MFIPGETIIHKFIIPFMAAEIEEVVITYRQNNSTILEKEVKKPFTDASIEQYSGKDSLVTYDLGQVTSLLFSDNRPYEIELNVVTTSHSRHTSKILSSKTGIQFARKVLPKGGD